MKHLTEIIQGCQRAWMALLLLALAVLFAACGGGASPAEEEQIKRAALDYFVRSGEVPEYEANIEEVEEDWARVELAPQGIDEVGDSAVMYLQRQTTTTNDAPTAEPGNAEPGFDLDVQSDAGWTVIAGPQVQFSQAELDAAGVPAFIRDDEGLEGNQEEQ